METISITGDFIKLDALLKYGEAGHRGRPRRGQRRALFHAGEENPAR